jgi:hypothetical protein
MKRLALVALAAVVCASAWAQGTFTIRRPLDGSTVREVVKVRIPKNSIPDRGYIGIYVNDQFMEAVLPPVEGEDYVYSLDTQGRKLSDGPAKIEAVLFVDFEGKPRIVNRTSINVTLDNSTSIKVPENGVLFRYKFTPGVERTYGFNVTQEVATVSQAQAQLGSRGLTSQSGQMRFRLLYAVDNVYNVQGRREALLRVQVLPNSGKNYADIVPSGETEVRRIDTTQMAPFYQRVTDTGRDVFGSVPVYFGIDGRAGAFNATDYFPIFPLPILPDRPVKVGAAWQAAQPISQGGDEGVEMYDRNDFFMNIPSRGEFVGVKWYKGIPCAIIKATIAVDPSALAKASGLNMVEGDAVKLQMESVLYFALDRGVMVREESSFTQESTIDVARQGNQGGGGSGGAAQAPGTSGAGGPGAAGAGGGRSTGSAGAADWFSGPEGMNPWNFVFDPYVGDDGQMRFFQLGGQRGGGQRGGGGRRGGGGMMGPGGGDGEQGARGGQAGGAGRVGGGGRAGGAGTQKMILRVRSSYVVELER